MRKIRMVLMVVPHMLEKGAKGLAHSGILASRSDWVPPHHLRDKNRGVFWRSFFWRFLFLEIFVPRICHCWHSPHKFCELTALCFGSCLQLFAASFEGKLSRP